MVDPDGGGLVVYAGDTALSGNDGGHIWAINAIDPNAAANCSKRWVFAGFDDPKAGSWSPPAFASDVNGRKLVVVGSSSPDNAVYALDAATGQRVWRFQTQEFAIDNDVGDGPTISAPGVNGFADGVVYVSGKDRIAYALNLRTGAKIWEFRMRDDAPTTHSGGRSTAALVGDRLYLGDALGMYALNAVTGARIWRSQDAGPVTQEILSAPAVAGPDGDQAVLAGDLSGKVLGFAAAGGSRLFTYQTGALIYGSPAIADGRLYITSSDGFLYAFGLDAGGNAPPTAAVTSPAAGADLPSQTTPLVVSGTAADDTGVAQVRVAIRRMSGNAWWNAATGKWQQIFTARLRPRWRRRDRQPPAGAPSSRCPAAAAPSRWRRRRWTRTGGDRRRWHRRKFTVSSTGNPPATTIASPASKSVFHFPNNIRQSFPIAVVGHRARLRWLAARHRRGAGLDQEHRAQRVLLRAGWMPGRPHPPVDDQVRQHRGRAGVAGRLSTTWTSSFPTYDHPHNYAINALGDRSQRRARPDQRQRAPDLRARRRLRLLLVAPRRTPT